MKWLDAALVRKAEIDKLIKDKADFIAAYNKAKGGTKAEIQAVVSAYVAKAVEKK